MRAVVLAAALLLVGSAAAATITGTRAADRLVGWGDGVRDTIRCGAGRDLVNADPRDAVAADCETVLRVIAADRTARAGAQHGTIVEPDSLAWNDTVVTVAQSGRYPSGGAAGIVFATSRDAARTWRSGLLPGLDRFARVSDPVVAYDPVRRVWLAATLGISPGEESGLLVSRSADGLAWEAPVVVDSARGRLGFDKEWIACDPWPTSPFHGRCYLVYSFVYEPAQSAIALRWSTDAGATWSAPVETAAGGEGKVGAYPVVRPNGDVVVLFRTGQSIAAARSSNGGATLSAPAVVSSVRTFASGLRGPAIPIGDVTADGRVLAVWQDCSARPACEGNDVAVASSEDGVTWSPPTTISFGGRGSAHVPAVAVDPGSGRVGVVTYAATGCPSVCRIDAWLVESVDGRSFGPPLRLSSRTMLAHWLAQGSGGAMLGDYISLSYVLGRPVPVVVLALPPRRGALRQALLAPVRIG
jgi:hypothetical protein